MAVNATAVWRVRAAGNNANGAGYDAAISGAGTDYSQQDTAQATGTHGASSNTTTFVDSTANAFTSAMVGNAIWIATGGGTVGAYFVTGYTSASTVTIDRAPGTVTSGSWKLGGAWANPWTNTTANIVPGNKVYIRGAGSNYPGTNDYTTTGFVGPVSGDTTNGYVRFIGENGRPRLQGNGLMFYNFSFVWFENLYITTSGTNANDNGMISSAVGQDAQRSVIYNCIFDQNGYDIGAAGGSSNKFSGHIEGCEIFSSVAPRGTQTYPAIYLGPYACAAVNNNIHDTNSYGIYLKSMANIVGNVIANCRLDGIVTQFENAGWLGLISGNTFSGNGGSGGITIANIGNLAGLNITNNIFANHTGVGQAGITYSGGGTNATNDRIAGLIVGNAFYNNTAHTSGFDVPAGNTSGTDPQFISLTNENFGVGSNMAALATPLPSGNGLGGSKVATVSNLAPGAAQIAATGSTTYVINKITTLFLQGDDYAP